MSARWALPLVALAACGEPQGIRIVHHPELEEAPAPAAAPTTREPTLAVVSAPDDPSLLPPLAPVAPQTLTLFGRSYTDSYAWLKTVGTATNIWGSKQVRFAHRVLDALPGRADTLTRVRGYRPDPARATNLRVGGGRLFFVRPFAGAGPYGKADVMMLERGAKEPRLLRSLEVRSYLVQVAPSPDGKFVAVERFGVANPIEIVEPGENEDSGVFVPGQAGSVAWSPSGDSLFYAAEQGGELVVRVHKIGAPASADRAIFGRGIPGPQIAAKEASIRIAVGKRTVTIVGVSASSRVSSQYTATLEQVARGDVPWRLVPVPVNEFINLAHGDMAISVASGLASPNEITGIDLSRPDAKPVVLVPAGGKSRAYESAADALYYAAPNEVARVGYDGRRRETIDLPPGAVVGSLLADPLQSGARVRLGSCLSAGWFGVSPTSKKLTPIPTEGPTFDASGLELAHEAAVSGSRRVDLTIVRAKGKPAAPAPALLVPSRCVAFPPVLASWIARGGVVGFCDIGDLGISTPPDVIVDARRDQAADLRSCAHKMIDAGHAKRLGVLGSGADGIAIANAVVREPALFDAVAVDDGIFDASATPASSRLPERQVNATATTSPYLASMPYFEIGSGPYPLFLFVVTSHGDSARMTAALQAAAPSRMAALLDERHIADNGYNGPDGRADAWADTEAFFRLTLAGDGADKLPKFIRDDDAARGLKRSSRH